MTKIQAVSGLRDQEKECKDEEPPTLPSPIAGAQEGQGSRDYRAKTIGVLFTLNNVLPEFTMAAPYKGTARVTDTLTVGRITGDIYPRLCVAASAITAYDLQHSFKNYNVLQEKA